MGHLGCKVGSKSGQKHVFPKVIMEYLEFSCKRFSPFGAHGYPYCPEESIKKPSQRDDPIGKEKT